MFRTAFAAVAVLSLCEPANANHWDKLIEEETQTKQMEYFFRPPSYDVNGDTSDSKRNF